MYMSPRLAHTVGSPYQTQQSKEKVELGSWEQSVEPFRADNAKLVKEVNELHMELVRRRGTSIYLHVNHAAPLHLICEPCHTSPFNM